MPWLVVLAWCMHHAAINAAAPRHYPPGDTTGVYSFPFHDAQLLARGQSNAGAVWVTPNARPGDRLPLFVYLHGLNADHILRRWLHGSHWDLRAIIGPMALRGRVGPMAVAVPATTGPSSLAAETIYAHFDVAGFVDATDAALSDHGYRVDRDRVIFTAHSAAGCALSNGLYAGVGSPAVQTVLDIDCCMNARFARALAAAPPSQRVVAVYQDWMWTATRDIPSFVSAFLAHSAHSEAPMGRALERYAVRGIDAHNDIVPAVLRRWLPEMVPPPGLPRPVELTGTVPETVVQVPRERTGG